MKAIHAVIIDDEIGALNTLRGMLGDFCPQIKILGQACTVGEARELIERLHPDLLFLDIEMPPFGNAFDLLKNFSEPRFGVIFTTAYPKYALQAIRAVQPWAYLVKPFSVSDLQDAVDVATKKLTELGAGRGEGEDGRGGIILSDARKGNIVIRFHEILYCKSEHSTVDVYVRRNSHPERFTTYKTLRDLEGELPADLFCRTHNSYLVNMQHIVRFEKTGRNGLIYLPEQIEVQISVQRMPDFEEKFQKFLQK